MLKRPAVDLEMGRQGPLGLSHHGAPRWFECKQTPLGRGWREDSASIAQVNASGRQCTVTTGRGSPVAARSIQSRPRPRSPRSPRSPDITVSHGRRDHHGRRGRPDHRGRLDHHGRRGRPDHLDRLAVTSIAAVAPITAVASIAAIARSPRRRDRRDRPGRRHLDRRPRPCRRECSGRSLRSGRCSSLCRRRSCGRCGLRSRRAAVAPGIPIAGRAGIARSVIARAGASLSAAALRGALPGSRPPHWQQHCAGARHRRGPPSSTPKPARAASGTVTRRIPSLPKARVRALQSHGTRAAIRPASAPARGATTRSGSPPWRLARAMGQAPHRRAASVAPSSGPRRAPASGPAGAPTPAIHLPAPPAAPRVGSARQWKVTAGRSVEFQTGGPNGRAERGGIGCDERRTHDQHARISAVNNSIYGC